MLVFNNSACIHKFVNTKDKTVALTTRVSWLFGENSRMMLYNQLVNNKIIDTTLPYLLNMGGNDPSDKY